MGIAKGRKTGPRHGLYRTPEAKAWYAMRARCFNSKNKDYRLYGARGITVCKEWDSLATFLRDVGPRPSSKHVLDRIDGNDGYFPENCRWATYLEQHNNRRTNRKYLWKGQKLTGAQIYRVLQPKPSIGLFSFVSRLSDGWSIEMARSIPARKNGGGAFLPSWALPIG